MADITTTLKECAAFKLVGRLEYPPVPKTSDKGTVYLSMTLKVKQARGERKFRAMAFGDVAEEVGEKCRQGDTVDIRGEIQFGKDMKTDSWQLQLIARSLECVESAVDADAVAEAYAEADNCDIPF